MNFMTALKDAWRRNDSLICVGLDPEPGRLPAGLAGEEGIFTFCRDIVDATAGLVCAFKPQIAHFAALGAEDALRRLIAHIHSTHPGVPVILDAKRGDIGSTAQNYAIEAFDAQAIGYLLKPFSDERFQAALDRALRQRRAPASEDFAFWCYLFGLMAFWGAMTSMDSGSEVKRFIYLLINLGLIGLAVKLKRTVFLVFGAVGVYIYLGHLAWEVFQDSVFFPFVLALLGLSLILGTVWGQRYWRRRLNAI